MFTIQNFLKPFQKNDLTISNFYFHVQSNYLIGFVRIYFRYHPKITPKFFKSLIVLKKKNCSFVLPQLQRRRVYMRYEDTAFFSFLITTIIELYQAITSKDFFFLKIDHVNRIIYPWIVLTFLSRKNNVTCHTARGIRFGSLNMSEFWKCNQFKENCCTD